ncbi:hypothetical protein Dda_7052 [Drechslerella dactyloides]|uniref:Uncharacterized protein n=1 Tax=Drechslerella dactyloides TaxID=74499 RepID=A0AAD6IWR7_DREDA|nr:hypothetical protein Dda_7052 [Drechslerella dactyloides]
MPPQMLLSLQRDDNLTWDHPRLLFITVACDEDKATTPIEIAKTLTRLPYNVREMMLVAIDKYNCKRSDNQVWIMSNLWTWSKKISPGANSGSGGNDNDSSEGLLDAIASLVLAPKINIGIDEED